MVLVLMTRCGPPLADCLAVEEISALLYLIGLIDVWNRTNIAVELPGHCVLPGT